MLCLLLSILNKVYMFLVSIPQAISSELAYRTTLLFIFFICQILCFEKVPYIGTFHIRYMPMVCEIYVMSLNEIPVAILEKLAKRKT